MMITLLGWNQLFSSVASLFLNVLTGRWCVPKQDQEYYLPPKVGKNHPNFMLKCVFGPKI